MTESLVQTEHRLDAQARQTLNDTAVERVPARKLKTFDLGFHGDRYLLDLVDSVLPTVDSFVETGSSVGNTLAYVAGRAPGLSCRSCEPGEDAWEIALSRIEGNPDAQVTCEPSPEFLERLLAEDPALPETTSLFFLDAHGHGYYWPLWDEVALIGRRFAKAFVLVDDLRVTGHPQFKFDTFGDLECTPESLLPFLPRDKPVSLIQPAYEDRTSTFHPLTGYGLYVWGVDFEVPAPLSDRFTVTTLEPTDNT